MKKVIDIEERIPSMREKRRRKTNKKFLFVLTLFVSVLLIIFYFQSPLSKVKSISIEGAILNESEYYKEQSQLSIGQSLWGFKPRDVEELISRIDVVKEASISRKWPNLLDISVEEWDSIAYIEERETYSLLLENGELFQSEILSPEADVPILTGFTIPEVRKQMSIQLTKMDQNVFHLISQVKFTGTEENDENVTVYMDDGYEVRAIIPTFSKKMDYYPDITAQLEGLEKGVIDMEVGTYFIPFSEVYGLGQEEEIVEEDE
ncbi:cell division protein FtsQ/DivIB [Sporosarcina sp. CAU 1771]